MQDVKTKVRVYGPRNEKGQAIWIETRDGYWGLDQQDSQIRTTFEGHIYYFRCKED